MLMTKAVIRKVQDDFPIDDQASVLEYLSLYGSRSNEPEIERVRLAILALADGDKDMITHYVGEAKQDYRNLLARV